MTSRSISCDSIAGMVVSQASFFYPVWVYWFHARSVWASRSTLHLRKSVAVRPYTMELVRYSSAV